MHHIKTDEKEVDKTDKMHINNKYSSQNNKIYGK